MQGLWWMPLEPRNTFSSSLGRSLAIFSESRTITAVMYGPFRSINSILNKLITFSVPFQEIQTSLKIMGNYSKTMPPPLCGTLCGWVWQVFEHQAASSKQASGIKRQASSITQQALKNWVLRLWQEIEKSCFARLSVSDEKVFSLMRGVLWTNGILA